ncbi:twin-arginine translocation signal domain-containing protein [Engelhardtia mirabilis]
MATIALSRRGFLKFAGLTGTGFAPPKIQPMVAIITAGSRIVLTRSM